MDIDKTKYSQLIVEIGTLLTESRKKIAHTINTTLVQTYWMIGKYIVEYEQNGKETAEYGSALLDQLSTDLTHQYGKGFSRSNVFQIRQFYIRFSKIQTVSGQFSDDNNPNFNLSWSHYIELIKADDDLELSFYMNQSEKENWSVRELKRQMKSMLFHRLALSKNKEEVLALSKSGLTFQKSEDILKDPYVLEFLNLPEDYKALESELEERLITNLQSFLLELGKGFTFEKRQFRVSIGGRHFYVDLVFYHRILKCFVLIDLKRGEVTHQDIGQMNLYLNYFQKEQNTEGDNPPIGIVLGASKNDILVEYATENIGNQLFVSKYQLYLPNKKQLKEELNKLLEEN